MLSKITQLTKSLSACGHLHAQRTGRRDIIKCTEAGEKMQMAGICFDLLTIHVVSGCAGDMDFIEIFEYDNENPCNRSSVHVGQ